MRKPIVIIGGGLAGCEAAWQLAKRGHEVELREMKPAKLSPAHRSPHLAELVCSNSLRSNEPTSAVGLLKEEMRRLDSLIMAAADATAVPAGKALAVDRLLFSARIEEMLLSQRGLHLIREECTEIPPDAHVIIATGPLTSDPLAAAICPARRPGFPLLLRRHRAHHRRCDDQSFEGIQGFPIRRGRGGLSELPP